MASASPGGTRIQPSGTIGAFDRVDPGDECDRSLPKQLADRLITVVLRHHPCHVPAEGTEWAGRTTSFGDDDIRRVHVRLFDHVAHVTIDQVHSALGAVLLGARQRGIRDVFRGPFQHRQSEHFVKILVPLIVQWHACQIIDLRRRLALCRAPQSELQTIEEGCGQLADHQGCRLYRPS